MATAMWSIRKRRHQRDDWRRQWRAVPPRAQRDIKHSLERGAPVADPALAPLAMEIAARRLGWIEARGIEGRVEVERRFAWLYAACALAGLALVWLGGWDWFRGMVVFWATLAVVVYPVMSRRHQRRLEQSHALNARLAERVPEPSGQARAVPRGQSSDRRS